MNLVENKSSREVEKALVKLSPETVKKTESQREISENLTELKLVIDNELKKQLDDLRLLLSHQNPSLSYVELIRLMAEKVQKDLKKSQPTKTTEHSPSKKLVVTSKWQSDTLKRKSEYTELSFDSTDGNQESLPASVVASRHIPSPVKRYVWSRDKGCCQYKDPQTGKACQSRYQIQIDHIHRYSHGGGHTPDNLRLLCRAHNSWRR